MNGLVERVAAMIEARVAWAVAAPEDCGPLAAAIVREVLAAVREPSEAMVMHGGNEIVDGCSAEGNARDAWRAMHDAFAREHGLEPPP